MQNLFLHALKLYRVNFLSVFLTILFATLFSIGVVLSDTSLSTPYLNSLLLNNYVSDSTTVLNIDPLILDLDGNGIDLIDFTQSNALFDIDNDGFVEQTGWVSGNDGILAANDNFEEVKLRLVG